MMMTTITATVHYIMHILLNVHYQGGEKVRTAEEVGRHEYEPPSEPIQFMTD